IFCGLSKPAQTAQVKLESYPANSASVKSYAVPVLPAAGIFFIPNSAKAAFPVPDSSASARQEWTSYAVSGLVTSFRILSRFASQTRVPSFSSIRSKICDTFGRQPTRSEEHQSE